MSKLDLLLEAERRGIATDDQLALLAEARKRGMVPGQPESEFSWLETARNIPESAAKFVKDITYPFMHPVETAKGLANLAGGVKDKYAHYVDDQMKLWAERNDIPQEDIAKFMEEDYAKEGYADQLGEMIKQRYGSMDAFKRTVQKDPVGVMADISALMTGAGLLTKSGKVAKAGAAIDPLNMTVNTARTAISKTLPKKGMFAPNEMYQQAAKFGTTIPQSDRNRLAQTALDYQLMPTTRGVDKLAGLTSRLNTGIDVLIDNATQSGKLIPRQAVFKYFKDVRKELGGPHLEGGNNLRTINKIAKSFDEHMKAIGKESLTPREMIEFKRKIYDVVDYEKRSSASTLATDVTRKAAARAAKEATEKAAPGIKEMNAELGQLLDLRGPLERSAGRIENRNIASLNAPLNIGAGTMVGGPIGTAFGTGMSLFELPRVKAASALALHRWGTNPLTEGILGNNPFLSLTRMAPLYAGRYAQEQ